MTSERKLVLVADDLPESQVYIRALLFRLKYRVVEAPDGRAAYYTAHETKPDLILMDVMMPKVDGLMSIKMLRANEGTRHIPIIVLTSIDSADACEKCLEAGADGFIQKPITAESLREALEKLDQA